MISPEMRDQLLACLDGLCDHEDKDACYEYGRLVLGAIDNDAERAERLTSRLSRARGALQGIMLYTADEFFKQFPVPMTIEQIRNMAQAMINEIDESLGKDDAP